MHQPIWFRSDRNLVVVNLVYFVKRESAVGDAKWTAEMKKNMLRIFHSVKVDVDEGELY